jgi:APA family basic amino acid/polyamine antiporter
VIICGHRKFGVFMTSAATSPSTASVPDVKLRRELGKWDLTAIGVNQVIGSAVFILPSQIAAQVGNWSPIAFVLVGLASLLVALCFAEAGSRFEGTGGAHVYARAAFGPFVAFEVGWMQWLTTMAGQATVVNAIALALGFYWPSLTGGAGRLAIITTITLTLAWLNLRGIRQSAIAINLFTISKLTPLAIFILVGFWFIEPSRLAPSGAVTLSGASTGALLLVFAFGGYHVIAVPTGEAADPRRHLPFAFPTTIIAVTAIMMFVQIVAIGTLPDLPRSATPLADASFRFMGATGALLMSVGAVISMTGNNMGASLAGSRMLFALAESGDVPLAFARIHPRYRTPYNAIIFTALVTLAFALSGSFATLAVASALGRLIIYLSVCVATLRLRQPVFGESVRPATFTIPLGPIVPIVAIVISLLMLAGANQVQFLGGIVALAIGAALYLGNSHFALRRQNTKADVSST